MDFEQIKNSLNSTPAFVFDEKTLVDNLTEIADLKKSQAVRLYIQ